MLSKLLFSLTSARFASFSAFRSCALNTVACPRLRVLAGYPKLLHLNDAAAAVVVVVIVGGGAFAAFRTHPFLVPVFELTRISCYVACAVDVRRCFSLFPIRSRSPRVYVCVWP